MSLLVCIRHIKDNNRELCLYTSGLKYKLVYESRNQRMILKDNITDEGYANYLFDILAEDLHMKID